MLDVFDINSSQKGWSFLWAFLVPILSQSVSFELSLVLVSLHTQRSVAPVKWQFNLEPAGLLGFYFIFVFELV